LTDLDLLELLYLIGGATTRSNLARENAERIAELAVCGYITTETPFDGFQSVWRLTPEGVEYLWHGR
jgi:hypothetical protein